MPTPGTRGPVVLVCAPADDTNAALSATTRTSATDAVRTRAGDLMTTPLVVVTRGGYPDGRLRGGRAHLVELLDGHEDGARLRALRRADHPAPFEQVHQPARPGEADAQLALQHARRPEPAAHHQVHRLVQQLVGVGAAVVDRAAADAVVARDPIDIPRRRHLTTPVRDDFADALLVDPRSLDALRPARAGGEEQHVALSDQLLRAGLVEDDARVREAAHREREPARHVRLDHAGDDVDRGALRRDDEVDPDGTRHLRDAADA